MGRTVQEVALTDEELRTLTIAVKVALAVAELDALKAHIRYDKEEMTYQANLIHDLEEVLLRVDR